MTPRQAKAAAKATDARIDRIYSKRCSGIQVNVMDLGKIFDHARKIAATGADDAALGDSLLAYVNIIRKN